MKESIKVKSIAFNLDDPHQYKLYYHSINTTNFSSYIKSLIQRDMDGNIPQIVEKTTVQTTRNTIDSSFVKGLI